MTEQPAINKVVRALVVDDSAFARKVVREMLSRSPYIEVVGTARDGVEALEMVQELAPDVITCDLMMPRLDGANFVREQMKRRPLPILIFSVAKENADIALEALQAGAVDFVQKPTAMANDDLFRIREELVEKVKAVAQLSARQLQLVSQSAAPTPSYSTASLSSSRISALVIGISTGGPQALRLLFPALPSDLPIPVAVVLHMPVGFTSLYAAKLNEICAIRVQEAQEGDQMQPGKCLLAPAGQHLTLRREVGGTVTAHLALKPVESLHRPSVDVLFQSAAEVYGHHLLGVVMTGMGCDGREGSAWIKARGGTILTEAEESCVIYGMPRAVVEAGFSDAAVPLARMSQAILERL